MNDKTYILAAKGISKRTNNELADMAFAGQELDAVMQEAWRRNNPELMYMVARSDYVISEPRHCRLLCKYVSETKNQTDKLKVVEAILSHSPEKISKSFPSSLFKSLMSSSTEVAALILISEGTPPEIVKEFVEFNHLDITREALFIGEEYIGSPVVKQNKHLEAILKMLRAGYSLCNETTAKMLTARLNYSSADPFGTALAKYGMSPHVASTFEKVVKRFGGFNALIKNNFDNNRSAGVKAWKLSGTLHNMPQNFNDCVQNLLILMEENASPEIMKYFLSLIETQCMQNEDLYFKILTTVQYGRKLFVEFCKLGRQFCTDILMLTRKILSNKPENIYLQHMEELDEIFGIGVNEFGLTQILSSYPDHIKKYIPAVRTTETQPVQKSPNNTIDDDLIDYRPMRKMLNTQERFHKEGENMSQNWYEMHKEAKLSDWFKGGTIAAAVFSILFLGKEKIEEVSRKYNIPIEILQKAINDPQVVEQARQQGEEMQQTTEMADGEQEDIVDTTFDDYIASLQRHEGLRLTRYRDHLGNPTIGWGHLIQPGENLTRITREQADEIFRNDAQGAWDTANNILSETNAPVAVQGIVAEMTFQMGEQGVRGFQNMIQAIRDQDYNRAADEMLDSLWARQTPARARELSNRMRNVTTAEN